MIENSWYSEILSTLYYPSLLLQPNFFIPLQRTHDMISEDTTKSTKLSRQQENRIAYLRSYVKFSTQSTSELQRHHQAGHISTRKLVLTVYQLYKLCCHKHVCIALTGIWKNLTRYIETDPEFSPKYTQSQMRDIMWVKGKAAVTPYACVTK